MGTMPPPGSDPNSPEGKQIPCAETTAPSELATMHAELARKNEASIRDQYYAWLYVRIIDDLAQQIGGDDPDAVKRAAYKRVYDTLSEAERVRIDPPE